MFTLSVFGIDNRINFTGVSLEMSRSHSSLQLHLECCLYERATGVKPEFLTSNHSDSDQSKIEDGDVLKTESLIKVQDWLTSVGSVRFQSLRQCDVESVVS